MSAERQAVGISSILKSGLFGLGNIAKMVSAEASKAYAEGVEKATSAQKARNRSTP